MMFIDVFTGLSDDSCFTSDAFSFIARMIVCIDVVSHRCNILILFLDPIAINTLQILLYYLEDMHHLVLFLLLL